MPNLWPRSSKPSPPQPARSLGRSRIPPLATTSDSRTSLLADPSTHSPPPPQGPITIELSAEAATRIPASQILRDAIAIDRDTTDLATLVAARWIEETALPDGKTETHERTATVADSALISKIGTRSVSISTDLTTASDAAALAAATLARSAPGGFTIPAAQWRPYHNASSTPADERALMTALDAGSRIGMPIVITSCDEWIPGGPNIPVYLDGGTYTYTKGAWVLDLQLTRAAVAGDSIAWAQTPTPATWERMSRITWADLSAVTI